MTKRDPLRLLHYRTFPERTKTEKESQNSLLVSVSGSVSIFCFRLSSKSFYFFVPPFKNAVVKHEGLLQNWQLPRPAWWEGAWDWQKLTSWDNREASAPQQPACQACKQFPVTATLATFRSEVAETQTASKPACPLTPRCRRAGETGLASPALARHAYALRGSARPPDPSRCKRALTVPWPLLLIPRPQEPVRHRGAARAALFSLPHQGPYVRRGRFATRWGSWWEWQQALSILSRPRLPPLLAWCSAGGRGETSPCRKCRRGHPGTSPARPQQMKTNGGDAGCVVA